MSELNKKIDPARFRALLNEFKLKSLFIEELGWDLPDLPQQIITIDGEEFTLEQLAHKRGVVVFLCSPDKEGRIPPRAITIKIDKETAKIVHEHLLVFSDDEKSALTWLWASRAPGEPIRAREHTWHKGDSSEPLRQKLGQIVWSLEEEEAVTLTGVITGLKRAFDRENVSRRFYDKFKKHHDVFSGFIKGLSKAADKELYASLTLNRLMFVYFIQKKGFLDGDENYLANRLRAVQAKAGKGKFHSFYLVFLRRLFHEGLGKPQSERASDLIDLIGDIPYLNGGLFALHDLEESYPDIDVSDEAFERLFDFFDEWDWHLDTRPLRNGNEINPDVLGYIFEKYINQKQMGAYYTKEDITGYISKNTVIPHLLETARLRCKVAFEGESGVWSLLKADPDRYIYSAMKTGVIDAGGNIVPESSLPDFVQAGMKDPKARMLDRRYNLGEAVFCTPTGERGSLPTETWREYVERRARCLNLRERLVTGEIQRVDDLVTLNLDIRQFMQDVITTAAGPDLLRAVWQAIAGRVPEKSTDAFRRGITVLDPTCGSGAFLFAALNILEPLYEACLDRMEGFCEDAKQLGKKPDAEFTRVLEDADKHPSRSYYVYKSIILYNLFGVDIMPDAVEICKLRFFLKLVSQADTVKDLEPLPDIDFNIRAGNALIGYATEEQFDAAANLFGQDLKKKIKADIADLADCFDRFRQQQTICGGHITADDKRVLRDKLRILTEELDKFLAVDYRIPLEDENAFAVWRASHQPFHWFAEFYGVMREGRFDVVIGNPPYLETREVNYSLLNYKSAYSKAIHAICIERSCDILASNGAISMIVPMALTSTQRMEIIQEILEQKRCAWFSNFAWRPAKLFDTVNRALTIFVAFSSSTLRSVSTGYIKWTSSDRGGLFDRLSYTEVSRQRRSFWIPKLKDNIEKTILKKLLSADSKVNNYVGNADERIYYRTTGGLYWKVFTNFAPNFLLNGEQGRSSRETHLAINAGYSVPLVGILSSNCFWWWYTITSNLRDLNPIDINEFPVPSKTLTSPAVNALSNDYIEDISLNSTMLVRNQRQTGRTETQSFKIRKSKSIIDQIDIVLAEHYGFTGEELDFIINYDIKYRMGGTEDNDAGE